MFQTDLNHLLQSFASDELTAFMQFITALGYPSFLIGLSIVLIFVFDFKRTFVLIMIFLWTIMITFFFKEYFDLPRPFHVDNTVVFLDGSLPDNSNFNFTQRDAPDFWSALPQDVITETRKADIENGFPSGHTSGAIALWGALALLFRNRWTTIGSIVLMMLIPLSRVYLGVHFLADVLGGIIVGATVIGLCYPYLIRPDRLALFLNRENYPLGINLHSFALLILPLVGFLYLTGEYVVIMAYLLGFGCSFLLLAHSGFPHNGGTPLQRIGRMLLAVFIFVVTSTSLKYIASLLHIDENIYVLFFSSFLASLSLIWLSITAAIKLGWYKRSGIATS